MKVVADVRGRYHADVMSARKFRDDLIDLLRIKFAAEGPIMDI